jgi:hypothetical protein
MKAAYQQISVTLQEKEFILKQVESEYATKIECMVCLIEEKFYLFLFKKSQYRFKAICLW